ncbi:MAG: ABC transporter substrate-binding protein [Pseudomonadota bacterium]
MMYQRVLHAAVGIALAVTTAAGALAQDRTDVLIAVGEQGPSSLDTHNPVANDYSRLVAWNVYDRLVRHGMKTDENGIDVYDITTFEPELATSWEIAEDGSSYTFNLRQDATFHDGSPVTAEDVRWSFERAVAAGGFPAIQMGASFFLEAAQFVAVDEHTFRIDMPTPNKYVMANLTVPIPIIVNKDLALEHATADDPWAFEWVGRNGAGGGAFEVARWNSGNELVLQRFDGWKSGELPSMKTVVYRQIPSAGTRRALVEKGDADVSIDLPPKDFSEMDAADDVNVVGVPVQSSVLYVEMNTKMPPFDDERVRKAIAYALPYEDIMANAYYGRAIPMFGAAEGADYPPVWPTPSPYYTDIDKARALLAEAGYPDGFETELYYDISRGTIREPMAILIKEKLAEIGIEVTIQKVPGANWFAQMLDKSMPMVIASFYAWLDWPEYHFYWHYHGGNNSVFNAADYTNDALDAIIDEARQTSDPETYDALISDMIEVVMNEVPKAPIARNYLDVALQPDVGGYKYWFHTQLDFRSFTKE